METKDIIIIGAGPVGLFTVFEAGLLGLNCILIDNLDKPGGQCAELYPEKPIYDIPGLPSCTGQSLVDNLLKQIEPFKTPMHLNQRIESLKKVEGNWEATTSLGQIFLTPSIFIAGGVGSFEPRKPPIENIIKFENKGVSYAIPNKEIYKDKTIVIFGGGDSALDWTVELSKIAKHIYLVHRREDFRAVEHTVSLMQQLVKESKVTLYTNNQIIDANGDERLRNVSIKSKDGKIEILDCDDVLIFHG